MVQAYSGLHRTNFLENGVATVLGEKTKSLF
jgi:hypothetical protein